MTERFQVPAKLRNMSMFLILIGIVTLIAGVVLLQNSHNADHTLQHADKARFWAVLLQNSVFFVMITTVSIFIQAAVGLAHGSWIVAFRRVPEAIGANVWVFSLIAGIVLFCIAFGAAEAGPGHNLIFHWIHPEGDKILMGKKPFLNPSMFAIFTIATLGLWSFFGIKFRALSLAQEKAAKNSSKNYWLFLKWAGAFLVVYALTQMSTTPWLWIMSVNAHWYSTMFSWYTFASAFVSGMSLILLFVIYLKNQGNLQLVTKEHMHDLGKFMFAFSIFWTYVWFAQYMLTWYANIPEETVYFKLRQQGPYSILFYAIFIINFIMPILILMARPSKRNYFTVTFMAMIIIFGHWLDFYNMIIPEPLGANWHMSWYEMGIFAGFIGLLIFTVAKTLSKASLVPENNVLLKETAIHQA